VEPLEDGLGYALIVDCAHDCLAHLDIIKWWNALTEHEEDGAEAVCQVNVKPASPPKPVDFLLRGPNDNIGLSGLERNQPGILVGNDLEDDSGKLRSATLPVAAEASQHDLLTGRPRGKLEGSRTDRLAAEACAEPPESRRAEDGKAHVRQVVHERRHRLLEDEAHRRGIDNLHVLELFDQRHVPVLSAIDASERPVKGELHGFGVQVGPVVKLHAPTETEGVGVAVWGHLPRRGEQAFELHVEIEEHQRLKDAFLHL
jgi:hypothetical protein